MFRRGVVALVPLLPLALVVAVFACNNGTQIDHPCSNIPDGGCPLSHDLACDDPACAAVYLCRQNNVWELQKECPPREPGTTAPADAATDADAGAASIRDASIDAPPGAFGGDGCVDLQPGDCALGVALVCGAGCCACEDLYVCSGGAWSYWGYCGPGGPVYSPQRN